MIKTLKRKLTAACTCCVEPFAATGVSRRSLLTGASALGLAATGFAPKVFAQEKPHRIDVHHHIMPPTWLAAMDVVGRTDFLMRNWSVQKTLEDMDKGGVATSMTSITLPQVGSIGKDVAVRVARESNEYAKKMMGDHPNRFGVWAMLPLPHIDESLKEIAYALDTLKLDGIGCLTSYGNRWLGNPHFAPVWEELNRRKATVYTHPSSPSCCSNLVQDVPDFVVEYGADTTRTIASLVLSGTSQKYKDINWIWSHGGGALTSFAYRLQHQVLGLPQFRGKLTLETMNSELRRFYYDTAAIPGAVTVTALKELVPITQIVYGTDFPYGTAAYTSQGIAGAFKGDDLKKVDRENAERLVPRLKGA